jgi:hypothetical protein
VINAQSTVTVPSASGRPSKQWGILPYSSSTS